MFYWGHCCDKDCSLRPTTTYNLERCYTWRPCVMVSNKMQDEHLGMYHPFNHYIDRSVCTNAHRIHFLKLGWAIFPSVWFMSSVFITPYAPINFKGATCWIYGTVSIDKLDFKKYKQQHRIQGIHCICTTNTKILQPVFSVRACFSRFKDLSIDEEDGWPSDRQARVANDFCSYNLHVRK